MARSIFLAVVMLTKARFLPTGSVWIRTAWAFFLFSLIVTSFMPELKHHWKLFLTILILIVVTEAVLYFLISPSVYARFSYWTGGSGALCNLV